jgi:cell division transport system permease protein
VGLPMLDWMKASPAERRLLPGGWLQGPTPYVIAIMMFVMVVIAAAGLTLANAASLVARGVENRYSVQIADGNARAPLAMLALKDAPGVAAIRPVPESDMRKTLERWLGPAGAAADLPLPALIDVDLKPGASPDVVAQRVERAVPGARFVAHDAMLRPMLRAIRSLTWLAFALVLLVALATAASVVLATRGALDTNRATIEIMHGIGATDDQIARLFQRNIALDSLAGGLVGAGVAGLVLLLIAGGRAVWADDFAGGPLLTGGDLLFLAALPVIGTLLATAVARFAVLRALRASL